MSLKALYLSLILHSTHAQTDVWYEQMSTDPSLSTDWTGTVPSLITADTTNCPAPNDYCWHLDTGSYDRVADTTGFSSVDLTYSIRGVGSFTGPDACYIEYSTDGSVFTPLETIDTAKNRTFTYSGWTGVAGIPALTIRISLGGGGHDCYFNEFRLHGTPATPAPTDSTSTPSKTPTSSPSKSPTTPTGTPSATPSGSPTQSPSKYPTISTTDPSTQPSNTPSQPPTDYPSLPPTIQTPAPTSAIPTSTPSGSPTQPTGTPTDIPSGSPSQPPSQYPSGSPTAPTVNPTVQTLPPTQSPTLNPTQPTSMPSQAPTHFVECGTYRYCYYRSIEPIAADLISETVFIQDIDHYAESYYDIVLDITGLTDCNRPILDMTYEGIQHYYSYETLQVSYQSSWITTCPTSISNGCGQFWTCLDEYKLPSSIAAGDTVTITITKSSNVHAQCTSDHVWAINAVFTFTCDDEITTASPTESPTFDPTDPPTSEYCSRESAEGYIVCYQQYIWSATSYSVSTYRQEIRRADGYDTDIYDVYFTAWYGPCYNPYINVGYRSMVSTNGLSILDDDNKQIGSCAAAKDCYSYVECLTGYDLGMQILEYKKTYRVTLFGRNLQNFCDGTSYSYYTTDAYVELVCDELPTTTLSPTGAPTSPTIDPTTDAPTQPTLIPTPNPTLDLPDGADVVILYIISHMYNTVDDTYSLILMTQSSDDIYVDFDYFLESPIQRGNVVSRKESSDDSYCIDSDCTQFFNIKYTQSCGFDLNGEYKAQFSTNCNGDTYLDRKECLDSLIEMGITSSKIFVNGYNELDITDDLCTQSLYSRVFTPDITYYNSQYTKERSDGNRKYREGDVVYMDVNMDDEEYVIDDISIGLVFGCSLGNITRESTDTEAFDGITQCLKNSPYILNSNFANMAGNEEDEGAHVWFTIPYGVKSVSEIFTVQIQTIVQINGESDHMRHFLVDIEINGKENAAASAALDGGTIALIVVGVVFILIIIVILYYVCGRRNKASDTKKNTDDALGPAMQLEAVKSHDSDLGSPSGENRTVSGYKTGNKGKKQKSKQREKVKNTSAKGGANKKSIAKRASEAELQTTRVTDTGVKKGGAKKAEAKKAETKKAGAKKAGVKKAGAKKAGVKKTGPKKAGAKNAGAKGKKGGGKKQDVKKPKPKNKPKTKKKKGGNKD